MTAIQIKNCGLSCANDIAAATNSGADYIGLVHFPASPRHLEIEQIANLLAQTPATVQTALLLVNPSNALLENILNQAKPDYLQLHGEESPERVGEIKDRFNLPIIKALGISNHNDISKISQYEPVADIFLLDAKPPKDSAIPGGRGETFDWTLLKNAAITLPWFLAGGLHSGNVAEAICISGAKMVDVSSGIELRPGQKDATKIAEFNRTVKASS